MTPDSEPATCAIDPAVAAELPRLELRAVEVHGVRDGRSPPEVRERLRALADRWRGPQALVLRTRDVPAAYRILFRHLGLDPDVTPTPVEALVLERLHRGGLPSGGLVADALAIACLETGVGVWALADPRGPLAIRRETPPSSRLVVAAGAAPVAPLFGDAPPFPRRPARALLYAVGTAGVATLAVDEALWIAADLLTES